MLNIFLLKKIMHLIKLEEIDSTNNYLKQINKEKFLDNYTTIFTENQTNGKGQMGSKWIAEKGKNLTFSTLISLNANEDYNPINLNMMVAVSIIEVLEKNKLQNLAIKWPNDILLENKKIGGILIEQSKNINQEVSFIIGIGLNVGQKDFENLPNASSIEKLTNIKLDKNFLLIEIVTQLKNNFAQKLDFKMKYLAYLFQFKAICSFKINATIENGKIIDISSKGLLVVAFENDIRSFGIKEIEMIY